MTTTNSNQRKLPQPFREDTFQTVPSLLLNDLMRRDEFGDPILERGDIALYCVLKGHSRTKDACHPGYGYLAKKIGGSISTVSRGLRRLERAGHIARKESTERNEIIILTDVITRAHAAADTGESNELPVIKRNRPEDPPPPIVMASKKPFSPAPQAGAAQQTPTPEARFEERQAIDDSIGNYEAPSEEPEETDDYPPF